MADNAVSTLAPEKEKIAPKVAPLSAEKNALFDSIAQEGLTDSAPSQGSPMKSFFTGLLWFGYAVAIVVALALVWSAAKGLLMPLPH